MRGRYSKDDRNGAILKAEPTAPSTSTPANVIPFERVRPSGPFHVTGILPESPEDRNARENAEKQAAGEGPQVYIGPDTPAGPEDIRAIVRHVAMQEFRSGFDFGADIIREYYPELNGITDAQIATVIAEDLE